MQACNLNEKEVVCEAGTGSGVLTRELCKRAGHVVSYEIDKQLFNQAQSIQSANLKLINRDLFSEQGLELDVFVSNLPYSKSRDAFEWLATTKFNRAVVMVQKEFAEKLLAKPGEKNYRAITAIASICFACEPLFDVPANAFEPPPKVKSTVLEIRQIRKMTRQQIRNVNLLFSKRNRKASTVSAKMGLKADFGDRRICHLKPEEIMRIAS